MIQYTKFFLVAMAATFVSANMAEAAAAAASGGVSSDKDAAASRSVVSLPGFSDEDIRRDFAELAKKPSTESAWLGLSSAAVSERDSKAVLAGLLPLDTLHFLNPEAYPTDNFEAIFRQLYRLVPYLDALKAKYMELSRKPSHKGGGDVRPVLPSGGDLSEKDKALLNRNAATAARAEVEAAMTILQRECDDAKLALQSTKTQTARVLAETRAPLDAEIDRLRSVIEAMGGTTRAVQSEVSALKAELALREEATRRVAAQAAKQDALSSERDEAFAKALAAEEAIAAEARKVATLNGLLAESDAAKRELSARAAALLEANLGLQAHVTRLSAQLATLGAEPVK